MEEEEEESREEDQGDSSFELMGPDDPEDDWVDPVPDWANVSAAVRNIAHTFIIRGDLGIDNDDLWQKVMVELLKTHRKFPRYFDRDESLIALARTRCRWVLSKERMKHRIMTVSLDPEILPGTFSEFRGFSVEEMAAELPLNFRETFLIYMKHGGTGKLENYKLAAKELRISVESVKIRILQCYNIIRRRFGFEGGQS